MTLQEPHRGRVAGPGWCLIQHVSKPTGPARQDPRPAHPGQTQACWPDPHPLTRARPTILRPGRLAIWVARRALLLLLLVRSTIGVGRWRAVAATAAARCAAIPACVSRMGKSWTCFAAGLAAVLAPAQPDRWVDHQSKGAGPACAPLQVCSSAPRAERTLVLRRATVRGSRRAAAAAVAPTGRSGRRAAAVLLLRGRAAIPALLLLRRRRRRSGGITVRCSGRATAAMDLVIDLRVANLLGIGL